MMIPENWNMIPIALCIFYFTEVRLYFICTNIIKHIIEIYGTSGDKNSCYVSWNKKERDVEKTKGCKKEAGIRE